MSIKKSIVEKNKYAQNSREWDSAITDAKQRMRELKKAIKTFQIHRDAGEKWPGIKYAGTAMESAPAKG